MSTPLIIVDTVCGVLCAALLTAHFTGALDGPEGFVVAIAALVVIPILLVAHLELSTRALLGLIREEPLFVRPPWADAYADEEDA